MDPASILLYLVFLFLAAYFACSETAYSSVSKIRLKTLSDEGDKRAAKALKICDSFDNALISILIGNNLCHASCAALSTLVAIASLPPRYLVYGTLFTTLVVYLFGEMLPKSLGKSRSEEISLRFADSLYLFIQIIKPVAAVFSGISSVISRFFRTPETATVTEEELQDILDTIEDEGVLEPEKQELINQARQFFKKFAKDVMTPLDRAVIISSAMPYDKIADFIKTLPYSRIPVYEGTRNNIVGILPVNLFLSGYVSGQKQPLRKMLLKPYVFSENTDIQELLQKMRLNKLHMVFIADETGHKTGLLTMEDILEELVGEIQDESDAGSGQFLQEGGHV